MVRTLQAPTPRDCLRLTQGDRRLVDDTSAPPRHSLPQFDLGRLHRGFPPIIKEWGVPEALPLSRHPVSCPVGQLHRRYSHRVVFQISLCFSYCCGSGNRIPPRQWHPSYSGPQTVISLIYVQVDPSLIYNGSNGTKCVVWISIRSDYIS